MVLLLTCWGSHRLSQRNLDVRLAFSYISFIIVVVQLVSHAQLFVTPWTAACQASLSFTICQSLLKLMSIESLMHPNISSSVTHFSSCPQSFPASGSFTVTQLFTSGGQRFGASASASVLPVNIQCWSTCSPRYSQESSPTPQIKSINSLALSLLYGPTLTFIHDYWKNYSFHYADLCRQSNVSAF